EKMVEIILDKHAEEAMALAYDPSLRDARKQWLTNYQERDDVDSMLKQPLSLFINHELILFSKSDNIRSIPKLMDGFKEAHRKIVAGCHKKFHIGPLDKQYHEVKVADLDSFIS